MRVLKKVISILRLAKRNCFIAFKTIFSSRPEP
jgi:hypothetical protein